MIKSILILCLLIVVSALATPCFPGSETKDPVDMTIEFNKDNHMSKFSGQTCFQKNNRTLNYVYSVKNSKVDGYFKLKSSYEVKFTTTRDNKKSVEKSATILLQMPNENSYIVSVKEQ
ncbi:hypothetical protein PPL_03068 [Heterostelium album PN500]|uniref:Uncharacterized protein n=1 Tax=Heterostelium pallidum (strain ATCC 26659 / Pp 5 / PN500) TaxID=670386 RepID=D3B3U7_HETP5|nr:hypothetical protein PPL_03068 [Heterostelium album PN500]EFA83995.1 hypothetical protein PPL_03068 [Heterostelium album PN500]|eukprot:XP_020436112.1 hypothetical protein PPL_03068 [Heterostelium album PN500]